MSTAKQMGTKIMAHWKKRTAPTDGHFMRHLDGVMENCAPDNLQKVHPFDSFKALFDGEEHADDWVLGLSPEEVEFVRTNVWNFCVTYQADGREPIEPPICRERAEYGQYMEEAMARAMSDPEVVQKTQEGDAAMESGDFDGAYEIYAEAKRLRDALLPVMEGPGDIIDVSNRLDESLGLSPAKDKPLAPMFGRRSVERTSIIVATPSRRHQPEGAPTRKEEVQARIAAREKALR